jgi:hypothetical protein
MTKPISLGFLVGSTYKPLIKTLSLNFLAGTTLDSRVTFSRGTNATLVDSTGKQTYAPNNLVLRSEEFDNASWNKSNSSVSANITTAPNGTFTADKLVENTAASTGHYAAPASISTAIGQRYILSVYAKAAERTFLQLITTGPAPGGGNLIAGFDLANGTAGTPSSTATSTITPVGDGWYRCSLAFPVSAGTTAGIQIRISLTSGTSPSGYTGDGTSGLFLWGAQIELVTYQTAPSTYVQTVASAYYGPRFDFDPVTLAPRGLLIEEQRVNLMTYSNGITGWTPSPAGCVTATANAAVSPDGTSNATKLATGDTASNGHLWYKSFSGAVSTTYTGSVYLKAGEYTRAEVGFENNGFAGALYYALFNLSNGTVVATSASTTATITNAGNGWYRCTVTATSDADGGAYVFAVAPKPASVTTVSANYTPASVGLGVFVYGLQVETGAFATSHLPTVASTVTRTVDAAAITGANFSPWFNASEGTYVVSASSFRGTAGSARFIQFDDGTTANNIRSGQSTLQVVDATVVQVNIAGLPLIPFDGTVFKFASTYRLNDFATVTTGAVVTDTSGTVPTVNQLVLGSGGSISPTTFINGHLRSIDYYPVRWADAQLPSLTV